MPTDAESETATDQRDNAPVDAGMDLVGVLESEEELQEWLESAFEECGWKAIREVSPHSSSCRADLIVHHDEYGWFGIETKYIGSNGGPSQMAKAHHQITQKYRGKKYIGNKIDLWAVCPYIKYCNTEGDGGHSYERFKWDQIHHTKPFFDKTGIGWINLDHYYLNMQFVEGKTGGRIPVGKLAQTRTVQMNKEDYRSIRESHRESCDMGMIRNSVNRKVEKFHYGNKLKVSV